MDYSARIEGGRWEGEARVPGSYFPPDITRWNAYAIHGPPEDRRWGLTMEGSLPRYEALFESAGPQADFHRLEKFQPLELGGLLEGNQGAQLSHVWRTALEEEKVKMQ